MGEPQKLYIQRELKASAAIRAAYEEIAEQGFTTTRPIRVGLLEKDVKEWAKNNGMTLGGDYIYFTQRGITHARRDEKLAAGIAVDVDDIVAFPKARRKMDVYRHKDCLIYTDYRNKFVIHTNYRIKMPSGKKYRINFITAGKVGAKEKFDHLEKVRVKKKK